MRFSFLSFVSPATHRKLRFYGHTVDDDDDDDVELNVLGCRLTF